MARKKKRTTKKKKNLETKPKTTKDRLIASIDGSAEKHDILGSSADGNALLSEVRFKIPLRLGLLDYVLDGGVPSGRILQFAGPYSVGKSALCEYICHRFQQEGGIAHYIASETTLKKEHLESYGLKLDEMRVHFISTVEDSLGFLIRVLQQRREIIENEKDVPHVPYVIVWDSLAASAPKAVFDEDDPGKAHMAPLARLMSRNIGKIAYLLSLTDSTLIFTNQHRVNVGSIYEKYSLPGGESVKHHSSLIGLVRRAGNITNRNGDVVGTKLKLKAQKNHLGRPLMTAEYALSYHRGIDPVLSLFNVAKETGFIKSGGGWFSFQLEGEEKKYRGAEIKKTIRANFDKYYNKLYPLIVQKIQEEDSED